MKNFKPFYFLFIAAILISCNVDKNMVNEKKINNYTRKMNLPANIQYRMTDSLQSYALERGQPYLNVYDKQHRELRIGTCYMELPYFIDTLLVQKKQVRDTLCFYQKTPTPIEQKIKEMVSLNGSVAVLDQSKKYYVFYHYAMYAKEFDSKVMPFMYEKYKDSVQFFFINTDKFQQ